MATFLHGKHNGDAVVCAGLRHILDVTGENMLFVSFRFVMPRTLNQKPQTVIMYNPFFFNNNTLG